MFKKIYLEFVDKYFNAFEIFKQNLLLIDTLISQIKLFDIVFSLYKATVTYLTTINVWLALTVGKVLQNLPLRACFYLLVSLNFEWMHQGMSYFKIVAKRA